MVCSVCLFSEQVYVVKFHNNVLVLESNKKRTEKRIKQKFVCKKCVLILICKILIQDLTSCYYTTEPQICSAKASWTVTCRQGDVGGRW